ncbi:hypothetical protein [Microbacterium allomyrinae]|uniref:Uncharacterized protein n=1 Tax=Microbacterium allomyrinae TaxID=2830666 RepID=A0A9X1S285_9MICO|nr:hypothetical protein [Microbacterium allomyrinae]MCC2030628.1 hypothetical protein [Microbacterium allomyrinae]
MKALLARAAGWFSDSRRAAIQALITSALTLLVVLGQVSADQSTALATLAASVLIAAQGVIGLVLLRSSEWYTWFNTAGRAAIYSLAAALGAVGIIFNVWGDETAAQIVAVATVLVSILTAFVQVVNAHTLDPVGVIASTRDDVLAAIASDRAAREAGAARAFEAHPSTFAKERDPEWTAPFSGLRVAVFSPTILPTSIVTAPTDSDIRELLAPAQVLSIVRIHSLEEFNGVSVDVVLSTAQFTRALLEAVDPALIFSVADFGDRLRYVG